MPKRITNSFMNGSDDYQMNNDHKEKPLVSVICMAYNHESQIKMALDGFVMQETDFPFEVIVHDDASTDGTADAILEYQERYPGIIKPIFQKENQYSQGVSISSRFIYPKVRGKYVALCEGDDCWIDPQKLQRQFDYMEVHPECSMCTHNTIMHYMKRQIEDTPFNEWDDVHILNDKEIYDDWLVHTSSYFFRKEIIQLPEEAMGFWSGDYARIVWARHFGTVVCLPYTMSVYNFEYEGSIMSTIHSGSNDLRIDRITARRDFLLRYIASYPEDDCDAVQNAINRQNFRIKCLEFKDCFARSLGKREKIQAAQRVHEDAFYDGFINKKSIKGKLLNEFAYRGYFVYPVWDRIIRYLLPRLYS